MPPSASSRASRRRTSGRSRRTGDGLQHGGCAVQRLHTRYPRAWRTAGPEIGNGHDCRLVRLWQGHARAAIAAMRNPNSAMLGAVTEMWQQRLRRKVAEGTIGQYHPHETFTENWQAMIDAALREFPGEPQAHQRAQQEDR